MIEAVVKGLGFGLLLSISVGPVLFSIIKQSLNNGHRGGLAFVAGVSASDIALVLLSNVFTALITGLLLYRTQVGMAGCVFLISLGIYFLFFKKIKVNEMGRQVFAFRKRDYARIFLSGFLMNSLNPAILLFWITTSTAVISHNVAQRWVIFVTCLLWMLLADVLKVFLAGKIRNRLTPQTIHRLNQVNGVILIFFGLLLLWGLFAYGDRI